jgi:hypothetical protein
MQQVKQITKKKTEKTIITAITAGERFESLQSPKELPHTSSSVTKQKRNKNV